MWDELVSALEPLTFWGTWVVLFVFLVVCAGVFVLEERLIGYEPSDFDGPERWGAERLIGAVGHTVLVAGATGLVAGLLLPATFGEPRLLHPAMLAEHGWLIVQCIALGALLSFLVTLVPIVGALAAQSPGVTVYVTAVCVHRGLLRPVLHPPGLGSGLQIPDLWESVAWGAVAVLLILPAKWAYLRLSSLSWREERTAAEGLSAALAVCAAAGAIAGLVPFLLYAGSAKDRVREEAARVERTADDGFEDMSEVVRFLLLRFRQFRDLTDREMQAVGDAVRRAIRTGEMPRADVREMASVLERTSSLGRAYWECMAESFRTGTVVRTAEYERLCQESPIPAEAMREYTERIDQAARGELFYVDDDGNLSPLDASAVQASLDAARGAERRGAAVAALLRGIADEQE